MLILPTLLVLLTSAASSSDYNGATCVTNHPVTFFSRLDQMPVTVRQDFLRRVGSIAAAGEPSDGGDVGPHVLPTRRFVRSAASADQYFIGYERGGSYLSMEVMEYRLVRTGSSSKPTPRLTSHLTGNSCAAVDATLYGEQVVDPRL